MAEWRVMNILATKTAALYLIIFLLGQQIWLPQAGFSFSWIPEKESRPIIYFKSLPMHHPVLGVPICRCEDPNGPGVVLSEQEKEELRPRKLSDSMIRGMIDFSLMGIDPCSWASAYGYWETGAARTVCDKLKGMSKRQIVDLLGPPACHAKSPLCQPELLKDKCSHFSQGQSEYCQKAKGGWLYFFGGIPILIRLNFENGICEWADYAAFHEDPIYCAWEESKFRQFVVGKTKAQIVKKYGVGLDGGPHSEKGYRPVREWFLDGSYRIDNPDEIERIKNSDELMRYQFGEMLPYTSKLYFKNGVCRYVDDCSIGSLTFGWPSWVYGCESQRFICPK